MKRKISLGITEFMAGHPGLVSVVLGVGLTFAVATTLSILVGAPLDAFGKETGVGGNSTGGQ